MSIATLTSKNQITLPKQVRDKMRLHEGDQLEFEPDEQGHFVIRKGGAIQKSDGAALKYMKRREKPLSSAEMEAAIRQGVLESYKRRNQ